MLAIRERLAEAHPGVPTTSRVWPRPTTFWATTTTRSDRPSDAGAAYRASLAIRERLAEAYPEMTAYAIDLGVVRCNLGRLARDAGRSQEALSWYDRAIKTLESVHPRVPEYPPGRTFLRNSRKGRAAELTRLGRHAEAAKDWSRAMELGSKEEREKVPHAEGHLAGPCRVPCGCSRGRRDGARRNGGRGGVHFSSGMCPRPGRRCGQERRHPAVRRAGGVLPRRRRAGPRPAASAQEAGFFKLPANVAWIGKDPDLEPLHGLDGFTALIGTHLPADRSLDIDRNRHTVWNSLPVPIGHQVEADHDAESRAKDYETDIRCAGEAGAAGARGARELEPWRAAGGIPGPRPRTGRRDRSRDGPDREGHPRRGMGGFREDAEGPSRDRIRAGRDRRGCNPPPGRENPNLDSPPGDERQSDVLGGGHVEESAR